MTLLTFISNFAQISVKALKIFKQRIHAKTSMNKAVFYILGLLFFGALLSTGCKKSSGTPQPDDAPTQFQLADDDARVQFEANAAADDANAALSGDITLNGGRKTAALANTGHLSNLVVGADSIVYDSSNQTVIIYYDGTTAYNGRIRSGSLSVKLTNGANWAALGATITLTFNNYKSLRIKDNSPLLINGQKIITNFTGGLVSNLAASNQDSVIHLILSVPGDSTYGR